MAMKVTVKYSDLYEALKPLTGLKLRGSIQGRPLSRFPLKELVNALYNRVIGEEKYREHEVVCIELNEKLHMICHFNIEEPDDFCIAIEDENPWQKITEAALKVSKLTGESYTLTLSALVHAIQGLIASEEEAIEKIEDPDQVIEELITWLPDYITVID